MRANHACVCLAAAAQVHGIIHRLRSLGIEQERSPKQHQGGEDVKKKGKKRTSFSPCLACAAVRDAMPRLMPSRAQREALLVLVVAHCMIWLVTAGPAGQARPAAEPHPHGLRAAFSASMAAAFGARRRPSATKSIASLLIFHPITHSAGAVRGRTGTAPRHYLPFLALKTSLGQSVPA